MAEVRADPGEVATRAGSSLFVNRDGGAWARIDAYHRLPPFLMTLAFDTDLWMFLSSAGGLTAGRVDPEGSLFPYETVDKLHESHHHTGPVTLVRVRRAQGLEVLWEPLTDRWRNEDALERNLYKNRIGNQVLFEEIRSDLGLTFRARWSGSDPFGLVRTASIENLGPDPVFISMLDGLRNVLPYGVNLGLQEHASSLVDAYKRSEVDGGTGLGVFSLTSRIHDRPEAAEELRANTVWVTGLERFEVSLAGEAVAGFRRGEPVSREPVRTGRRGNYLVTSDFELAPRSRVTWHLVADVGRSQADVAALRERLMSGGDPGVEIEGGIHRAGENLIEIVASADGLQLTSRPEICAHHFANVLFNCMRGGVFSGNHDVPSAGFAAFLNAHNREAYRRWLPLLNGLPPEIPVGELHRVAEGTGDIDFRSLAMEYLPLWFGRRHGDPSRPWNRFTVRVRNPDGTRALHYEGNWRDIFQNWEALCLSFPGFLPGVIAKFVNASTVDGFNPYRISWKGVDWETPDPREPWGNIGYWGDHQIVYLLRILERLAATSPGALEGLLEEEIFSYAEVPYRLAPYEEILANPRSTIVFDAELDSRISRRVLDSGSDGKLLPDPGGRVYRVSLLEKLLVPALSKLSNLVPEGGIWMNTQRPEWNDANNALVGYGLSVVTLCHLRRYMAFLGRLLGDSAGGRVTESRMSVEVVEWFRAVGEVLREHRRTLDGNSMNGRERKRVVDALGSAFSRYRSRVYRDSFSGKTELTLEEIRRFCRETLPVLDHSIRANRREDGLYHAYNLMEISSDGSAIGLRRLPEMLEGQVAALGSGVVGVEEAVELLQRLFESRLYREAERSFVLYPERSLPGFLEKNLVDEERALQVPLLRKALESEEGAIVERDASGRVRFHPDLANAEALGQALERLAGREGWRDHVVRDGKEVLELYEATFRHREFTGRSGAMYGFEGLGCVYWHMVAKLMVAVEELATEAFDGQGPGISGARGDEPDPASRKELASLYHRIRAGLGFEKTPAEHGAFPTDPYSHTPPFGGARQPGMTGQVKEEILTRFGELGVRVGGGRVGFRPMFLQAREFMEEPQAYAGIGVDGARFVVEVPPGSLAFTFCQVPVVYTKVSGAGWIRTRRRDASPVERPGDALNAEESRQLLGRTGEIRLLEVGVPVDRILSG